MAHINQTTAPYPYADRKELRLQLAIWSMDLLRNKARLREDHRSVDDIKICQRNIKRAENMIRRIEAQREDL